MTKCIKSQYQPTCRQQSQPGFTLIELMVVLVIIGIISAIAAPDFQRWKHSRHLQQAARSIYSAMQQARLGAVKTGTTWAVWFDTANNRFYVSSDPGPIAGAIPTIAEWQSVADNLDAKGLTPPIPIYLAGKNLDSNGNGTVNIPPAAPEAGDLLDDSNIRYGTGGKAWVNGNAPLGTVALVNDLILFYPNGTASVVGAEYIYLDHCPDPANPGSNANTDACNAATAPAYAIGSFNTGFPVIRKWDRTLNAGAGGWE